MPSPKKNRIALFIILFVLVNGVSFALGMKFKETFVAAAINSLNDNATSLQQLSKEQKATLEIEAHFPGWATRSYNVPETELGNSGLLITGKDTPSGVFFTANLDSEETYEVTLDGQLIEGQASLRIQKGESPVEYAPAPESMGSLFVRGSNKLELLFYNDRPFKYRLSNLSLKICSDCKAKKSLKDTILSETPGLKEALAENNRLGAAKLILKWASVNADYAASKSIDSQTRWKVQANSASDSYFNIFKRDTGGVFCGGLAVFLDKIFHLFELNSFIINFGDTTDALTHVTVVLPESQNGGWKYHIFDPTFNAVFVDTSTGVNLDIFEILERSKLGQISSVKIIEGDLDNRDFIYPYSMKNACPELKRDTGTYLVCAKPNFSFENYLNKNLVVMENGGYHPGMEGFFDLLQARIFSVTGSNGDGSIKQFLNLLTVHDIPYGRQFASTDTLNVQTGP